MKKKTETPFKEMIKLSPVQNTGDCGYHVVIIGLFYLALKATDDEKIASMINSSKIISDLLAAQPISLKKYLEKPFKTNQECLMSYLESMATTSLPKISFNEILLNFTLQLKELNCSSDWLQSRVQSAIKSGLWMESNREWEKLFSFQNIMKKIQLKADELYRKATVDNNGEFNDDLSSQILFQAQIEACEALTQEELAKPAQEVITHFYTVDAPKVWVDSDFLKCIVKELLGTSYPMFDKTSMQITSEGPSSDHWYIELLNDKYMQKFISIYKTGYNTGLHLTLPGTQVDVTLSSYSSLFSSDRKLDTQSNPESTQLPFLR